eukprot:755376-Hanusia_phi.AAC.2
MRTSSMVVAAADSSERFLDNKKKLVQGDKDGNMAGVLGIHHYLWIRLDLPWKSFSISRTKELGPLPLVALPLLTSHVRTSASLASVVA